MKNPKNNLKAWKYFFKTFDFFKDMLLKASVTKKPTANLTKAERKMSTIDADLYFKAVDSLTYNMGNEPPIPQETPEAIEKRILASLKLIAEVCNPHAKAAGSSLLSGKLQPNPEALYVLYRMLHEACQLMLQQEYKVEDGRTNFIQAELKKLQILRDKLSLRPVLDWSFHTLMDNSSAVIDETDVGADFVLVVAGSALLGQPGARLIWVQAKEPSGTFCLRPYQGSKSAGYCAFRQETRLQAMADADGRAFAIYALYGRDKKHNDASVKSPQENRLDAVWSISAGNIVDEHIRLNASNPALRRQCSADIKNGKCEIHAAFSNTNVSIKQFGHRLPEHVIDMLLNSGKVFENHSEVRTYLSAFPSLNHLKVVGAFPKSDPTAKELVEEIIKLMESRKKTNTNKRKSAM